MSDSQTCPKCSGECVRDEVDVGVGVMHGPWGCYVCGWSDDSRYDASEGTSPSQQEYPDAHVDPCGGLTPAPPPDIAAEEEWREKKTGFVNDPEHHPYDPRKGE